MNRKFSYTKDDFKKGVGDYIEFKYRRFDPNLDWEQMFDEYEFVFGKRPESEARTDENHRKILFDFLNPREG